MIKRIVEISSARTHLSIRYGQLVVRQEGREEAQIPCEDIGVLLVDHPGVTYTHSVFTELVKNGGAVVLCGGNHHPAGMVLAIEGNTVQTERFRTQAEAKVLGRDCEGYAGLMALAGRVRSGDPSNVESQASKRYWRYFLEDGRFRRDVSGGGVNSLLNYGYMVMRAAVARALVSAGLMVTLGIHHRNRYNAFCLADDVMEPFRGFVEKKVRSVCGGKEFEDEFGQDVKAKLLEVLYEEVEIGGRKGPLMVGLHRTAASLARVFEGEQKEIDLPRL